MILAQEKGQAFFKYFFISRFMQHIIFPCLWSVLVVCWTQQIQNQNRLSRAIIFLCLWSVLLVCWIQQKTKSKSVESGNQPLQMLPWSIDSPIACYLQQSFTSENNILQGLCLAYTLMLGGRYIKDQMHAIKQTIDNLSKYHSQVKTIF